MVLFLQSGFEKNSIQLYSKRHWGEKSIQKLDPSGLSHGWSLADNALWWFPPSATIVRLLKKGMGSTLDIHKTFWTPEGWGL